MLSVAEARIRVARGAAHLDTVRPGWHEQIDIGTLELKSACRCIMGQLSNGQGWRVVDESLARSCRTAQAFGFLWDDDADDATTRADYEEVFIRDYGVLQDAWIEAIADRRLATSHKQAPASGVREEVPSMTFVWNRP